MKNRKVAGITLILSVLLILAAYILRNPLSFGFCQRVYLFGNEETCLDNIAFTVGEPLQSYAVSLVIISLFLFAAKKEVLKKWSIFASVWTLVTLIAVTYSPVYGNALSPIQRDVVSVFMSVLFVLVSLILLFRKPRVRN